jgi:hypothetical protein
MASTYPTTLDAFTNPTTSSLLTSPSHAQQHSDINDAMEAVQTKLAIGNTVIGTYIDHSTAMSFPGGVTVGNGTKTAYYCRVNNFVHFYGKFTLGSTSAITGPIQLGLPINMDSFMVATGQPFGLVYYSDASAGTLVPSDAISVGVANTVYTSLWNTAGTFASRVNVSSGNPFTWAVSDTFFWNLYYKAA